MELLLSREWKNDECTIGELSINGVFECFILEDKDRELTQDMPLDQIKKIKVYGKTAIPRGRYEVVIAISERHQRDLPLLVDVPDYEGAEIHPGNKAIDTLGCLLPGTLRSSNSVLNSVKAFTALFPRLQSAKSKNERIFITIQ